MPKPYFLIKKDCRFPDSLFFRGVGKHSLPLSLSFDEPKLARYRSPVFNGSSILCFKPMDFRLGSELP